MSEKQFPYQPGVIFYDVILGLLRAKGHSFEKWCAENEISPSAARNAVFGQSGGVRGKDIRERLVVSAGADLVERAYSERVKQHAAMLEAHTGGAAA